MGNVSQVKSKQILYGADVDAVSASGTATTLVLLNSGPWVNAQTVTVTSSANNSGITFTVVGKDADGAAQTSAATTGPNAETISISGTWTEVAAITNKLAVDTVSTTTKLWKRTTGSNTTATRPLGWDSSNNSLKELSDAEINDLVEMYQESIVDTGIGKYALQAAAPGTGTWQTVGDAFVDTRKQRTDQNYAGDYTGSYTGTYAGSYSTFYSGRQVGPYTGYYTGAYSGTYTGTYVGATIMAATDTVSTMKLWLRTA